MEDIPVGSRNRRNRDSCSTSPGLRDTVSGLGPVETKMTIADALLPFGKHAVHPQPRILARPLLAVLLMLSLPLLIGARFRSEPCCGVIGVDAAKGFATIRDNKTGRTWQFEAGAATLSALKIGAQVDADLLGLKTLSIAGVEKAYALNEPAPTDPCCGISQIHLAALDGGIVVRNKATGATHHVTINNQAVLGALKVGQDVAMDAKGKWAIIRTDMNGKPETYSFPISSGVKAGAPCCSVIGVDSANGIVTIREKATDLTTQFEAGAQAIRAMKEGDDVITGAGPGAPGTHVLSVKGVARSYSLVDVAPGQPCCAIAAISVDPGTPCCAIVTARDKATGRTMQFRVDGEEVAKGGDQAAIIRRARLSALKVGQDVSMDPSGKWAMFRQERDGRPATYSFPIDGAGKKPSPAAETAALWEIRPNPELKGALGRLVFGFNDKDAIGGATILPAGQADGGQLVFLGDPTPLPPGKYDILVNGAPVKNVPVETRMDTVMKVGLLSVTAGVKAGIYDLTKKTEFHFVDGGKTILPVGSYYLKSTGGFSQIVIRENQVTEF